MTATAVSVTVEELSPVTRALKVEVPVERVSSVHSALVSEFRQSARVPGFRAGKAPVQVIARNYKEDIRQALLERLVRESIGEAVEQYDGRVIDVRDIQPEALEDAAPFRYSAVVEVPPTIDLKNYKKLKLQKPVREVSDEDVDRVIDNLRERNATYRAAADQDVAAEGDRVTLTYHAYDNGELVPDGHIEGHTAELGAGALHPKFEEQLMEAKPGAELAFAIAFGQDDAPSESLRDKTIDFKVVVDALEKRELPEFDDAFAATMLDGATEASLRERIQTDLAASYAREAETALENQVVMQLLEAHDLEVPESAVRKRQENIAYEVAGRLQSQGYPEKTVKDMLPMIAADSVPRAERETKITFILQAIADAEGVEATDANVDADLQAYADQQGQPLAALKARLQQQGQYESIRNELRNRKALQLVVDAATIKDVTPEAYQKWLDKQNENAAEKQPQE